MALDPKEKKEGKYRKISLKNRKVTFISESDISELVSRQDDKVFAVGFVKKGNGKSRLMNVRQGVKKYVKGNGPAVNPALDVKKCFSMLDDGHRRFNDSSVYEIRAEQKIFRIKPNPTDRPDVYRERFKNMM